MSDLPEKFTKELDRPDPDPATLQIRALKAKQPIGDLYFATLSYKDLVKITYFDVRRTLQDQRDIERYLGIQRPLIKGRVKDLQEYVNFKDASYPTAVIVAIDDDYVEYDEASGILTLRNFKKGEENNPTTNLSRLAKVIDGQHRIAGLTSFRGPAFDVPTTIFVGSDIADQAYVFSTVNLEQTKVGKSLAFDLFSLAKSRSPQKTAHNIAVALDREPDGPLEGMIKRLGVASEGEGLKTITQATFVEALLDYISDEPKTDRDILLRGGIPPRAGGNDIRRLIFRNMFIDERDKAIATSVSEYFAAIRERWPEAWGYRGGGRILNRTNGFRGAMKALKHIYRQVAKPGDVVMKAAYLAELKKIKITDAQFTVENFPPGSSGEAKLRRVLTGEEVIPPPAS
jgi:DGQHR domain-containing protein